jgi:hypothetical protein
MIAFGGTVYVLDMDKLTKAVSSDDTNASSETVDTVTKVYLDANGAESASEVLSTVRERGREIDSIKYDLMRTLIEVLLDGNEEADESLGVDRALDSAPLSFKIAFNTLLQYGILKEIEE